MKVRHSASVRLLGIAILVLALSPVTAPFSTLQLGDLFGEAAQQSGAIVQSKTGLQQAAADLDSPFWRPDPLRISAAVAAVLHLHHGLQRVRVIPLRI